MAPCLGVGAAKRKAVVSADAAHLDEVEALVRQGKFRTVSDFVRRAVAEKLERIEAQRLADEVARYCDEKAGDETDAELVEWQAFDEPAARRTGGRRRAKG